VCRIYIYQCVARAHELRRNFVSRGVIASQLGEFKIGGCELFMAACELLRKRHNQVCMRSIVYRSHRRNHPGDAGSASVASDIHVKANNRACAQHEQGAASRRAVKEQSSGGTYFDWDASSSLSSPSLTSDSARNLAEVTRTRRTFRSYPSLIFRVSSLYVSRSASSRFIITSCAAIVWFVPVALWPARWRWRVGEGCHQWGIDSGIPHYATGEEEGGEEEGGKGGGGGYFVSLSVGPYG
jgi:hypothetical protein